MSDIGPMRFETERRLYVPPVPSEPARLYRLAGLDRAPAFTVEADGDGELVCDQVAWRALVAAANRFARAGGVVTPDWFAAQELPEQLALVDAQDRLWAARAATIGTATLGRVEAANVLSPADGGRAALRAELYEAALRGAREAHGREVGR